MSADALAAVGAFLSGAAAVTGTWLALRGVRRRKDRECEEKIELYRRGIAEGRGMTRGDET